RGKAQRRLDSVLRWDIAFDNCQFPRIQPHDTAALARVDYRIAAAGVGVRVHAAAAARTLNAALQFDRIKRLAFLLVRTAPGAALVDDQPEAGSRGEKPPAALAVTDRFALHQGGQQRYVADGTVHAGRVAEDADPLGRRFGEVEVAAVLAVEITAAAHQLHRRAAAGTVHHQIPPGNDRS